MIALVLLVVFWLVIAVAIWADDKSWGSFIVGALWPLWLVFFALETLFE